MIALSIRQPWAWLIVNGWKDIENRTWATRQRGRILVHASKGMTRNEYEVAFEMATGRCGVQLETLPPMEELQRGGIVGAVDIVDCVHKSESPWYVGDYGFVLRNPTVLPFVQFKGALGFFNVPDDYRTPQ